MPTLTKTKPSSMASKKKPKESDDDSDSDTSGKYKIKVIDTAKSGIPQIQAYKDGVMPKFPFSMLISGASGSGKSNLMINIMTNKDLYGGYFHYVIVFSPTAGETDDLYKQLKLPKENYIREMKPEYLTNLIEKRKARIAEKGIAWVGENERMVLIMDDVIADRAFLESPDALMMFTLLRHFLVSIIALVQSYNKMPRTLRNNANAIMVFPSLASEIETMKDEITPAGISKRDFEQVLGHATKSNEDGKASHNFFYMNKHTDESKRYRRNLDEVLDLDKFRGTGIARSKADKQTKDVVTVGGPVEKPRARTATTRVRRLAK